MSHKKREWFISIGNEATHKAVFDIDGFDQNTDFEKDAAVHEKVGNKENKINKNLARISLQGKRILERNRLNLRLKFNVYMRETPDSKIFLWVGESKPKKVAVNKRSKSLIV